ncbi:cell division protein PerM [Streptomyces johnsoniae]|uniref:DUF6350 family protein n=1 Tax=Streptomyces johnsoniae TaxID=3075532 RepID=A0ABU2S3Y2_9ACTN|nr:DUF6350 family protein [Streptomyces sp. DSM 41886]MDT0443665.1 DUF6350 family protein [Streptomyces sp. DSM 41886]
MRHVLRRLAPLSPVRARWLLEGLLAAGLGLGALAVPVLLLWTLSPYPDGGVGGALRVAADLWLLAHGADLVRQSPGDAFTAPVGVTPLLLAALPAWLLNRAVRACDWAPQPGQGALAALWITSGYLLAAAGAVLCTAPATLAAQPLSAAWHLPLFALAVTLTAAFTISGPPFAGGPGTGGALDGRRLSAGRRLALTGVAACCAAGTLLLLGGLLLSAASAQAAFGQLATDWAGRLAVLLLTLALLPNAVVWAVAYGLGPGFTAGAGSAFGPLAVTGTAPDLPPFPLLAALPATAGGPWLLTAAALVPAAGAAAVAWTAARLAVPERGERATASGWGGTALTVLLAACGAGAAFGLLAAFAGGPLGTGALATFGPEPWTTGLAAAAWTAVPAVPAALVLRAWRLRRPRWIRAAVGGAAARAARLLPRRPGRRRGKRGTAADAWHTTAARDTRWAALRKSSGTLVPEITEEPRHRP